MAYIFNPETDQQKLQRILGEDDFGKHSISKLRLNICRDERLFKILILIEIHIIGTTKLDGISLLCKHNFLS